MTTDISAEGLVAIYGALGWEPSGKVAVKISTGEPPASKLQWLYDGMSMGSAAAFMITGPSTKITNLGALKIVLGIKNFILYLCFVIVFSFVAGVIVNMIV